MLYYKLLLLLPLVTGFTNPSLSHSSSLCVNPSQSFHRDIIVLASGKSGDENIASNEISTTSCSNRRLFLAKAPFAAAATAMFLYPNQPANANIEDTRDLFRKPELVAKRKAQEQAIIDEENARIANEARIKRIMEQREKEQREEKEEKQRKIDEENARVAEQEKREAEVKAKEEQRKTEMKAKKTEKKKGANGSKKYVVPAVLVGALGATAASQDKDGNIADLFSQATENKPSKRTVTKKPVAKTLFAKKPATKLFAKKPVAKKPATKLFAKKPVAKKPVVKKPAPKRLAKKPVAKKPATKRPAKKPVAKKPATKRPAKKPVAKKPATKRLAKKPAKKPIAKKLVVSISGTRAVK